MTSYDVVGTLRTVLIDSRPLAFWQYDAPQARTLIMVHGLGSDHTGLLDLAGRLRGVSVVVPDLPGFGRSAPLSVGHTLSHYAAVLDELRRQLSLERCAVLGHSLGADVALAFAGSCPGAVSELVLLNPVLGAGGLTARLGELYCQLCAALPAWLARPLLASRAAVYLQDRASLTTTDRATRRRILEQDYLTARRADPRAVKESVRSIRESPFGDFVERVQAPTLVVSGTRDKLAPPASLARLPWRHASPQLEVVPGAGHLLPAEQPDRVAELVNRFLERAG
jgi:pimeloyl-ACP methyl ester carboxylesterase